MGYPRDFRHVGWCMDGAHTYILFGWDTTSPNNFFTPSSNFLMDSQALFIPCDNVYLMIGVLWKRPFCVALFLVLYLSRLFPVLKSPSNFLVRQY